jgi:UDP-glucose:(heptosyl)LPS alpha-1,3-glucosyltransferase
MPALNPDARPRRLRIAFVVHDYHRHGGHSRYVAELASRFKHDHEVHIFANTFEEPDPEGVIFHRVPALRTNVVASLITFLAPATWMVRGPFDIVHAQGVCGLRHNVVTAHICQQAWNQATVRCQGAPSWRKRVFHGLALQLERWIYRRRGAQRFIAVSRRMQNDLGRHYGCTEGVRVIYHGVDTETFHPRNRARWREAMRAELGLSDETVVALYVGDLQKALPAAVRALAQVPEAHLVAVSRSPSAAYRELIDANDCRHRIHLLPSTRSVERYYAAADFFLFPTLYDSFGLVATEAMASGLPVVCSQAAGAAELIEDGVNGVLVEDAWNPGQLAQAIRRLATDAEWRRRLGEAARRTIEPYTWDAVARQTMAVYQEVCAARNHRGAPAELS